MSVSASPAQLAALRDGDPAERIALVRLLRVEDPGAYARWLAALDGAVKAAGGRRVYRGVVDGLLVGDGVAADELMIDEFPSRELAAESLRDANPHAEAALAEALVLALRPLRLPWLVLRAAAFWARLRDRRLPGPRVELPDSGLRAIDPEPAAATAFLASQAQRPLDVLNLNQHRDRAAYRRYGRNTMPQLLRRRARPIWAGEAPALVVGDAAHALAPPWDEVFLVRYPSRGAMLDMLQDPEYQRGLPHREQGLARAALVAACPLPGASGHSREGTARPLPGRPVGEAS